MSKIIANDVYCSGDNSRSLDIQDRRGDPFAYDKYRLDLVKPFFFFVSVRIKISPFCHCRISCQAICAPWKSTTFYSGDARHSIQYASRNGFCCRHRVPSQHHRRRWAPYTLHAHKRGGLRDDHRRVHRMFKMKSRDRVASVLHPVTQQQEYES